MYLWHRRYQLLLLKSRWLLPLSGPVPPRHGSLDGLKYRSHLNPDHTDVIRDVVPVPLTVVLGLQVVSSEVLALPVPAIRVAHVLPVLQIAVRADLRVMVAPLGLQVPVRYS